MVDDPVLFNYLDDEQFKTHYTESQLGMKRLQNQLVENGTD